LNTHISVGSHACLISYADTHETDIPLVLVVGREPNGSSPVTPDWGTYDFRKSPNCAFWNIAYGLLGSAATPALNAGGVKKLALAKAASPIIIADAMPQSIDNAVRNKAAQRNAIADDAIEQHVANIFAHDHLIKRVRIVLLSGLDVRFLRSARIFEEKCRALNLPVQRLPFFYGTNAPKIRATITAETRQHLKEVADAFAAFEPTKIAA
jgi:hypothetical protein